MPGLTYPSAQRNCAPIGDVLASQLPPAGQVLEVASGSGEHAIAFARRFPRLTWQPTDQDPRALESILAWQQDAELANLLPPLRLDVLEPWPVQGGVDAVLCVNMIHISPWDCTRGLLRGAARLLPPGGLLYLYGPFNVDGRFTAPSNEQFDASLRARDPAWGLRDVSQVAAEAELRGLALGETVQMPANNLSLILRRT